MIQGHLALKQVVEKRTELKNPTCPMLRAAHNLNTGILSIIESRPNMELALMSWNRPTSAANTYGSPEKTLLHTPKSNLALLSSANLPGKVQQIFIPAGWWLHARLGLRRTAEIARSVAAELTLLKTCIPTPDIEVEAESRALDHLAKEVLERIDSRIYIKAVVDDHVGNAIIRKIEADSYDMLVIGASDEWAGKSLLVSSIPVGIADCFLQKISCSEDHQPRHT